QLYRNYGGNDFYTGDARNTYVNLVNSDIENVLNNVDGIYQRELNLTLSLTFQNVWTTSNDPYTSTDKIVLLSQFENEWNAHWTYVIRDVAHLFTGKMLDDHKGAAGMDSMCLYPQESYCVAQISDSTSPPIILYSVADILVAHEIAHTLGALHDDEI